MSTLITTITLSNIYPKDRTYTNRYDMALEIYQDSQSGTGSSGRTNYTAYLKGKASAGSGYDNWRGFVTASIKVNGSAITSFDVPTIKGNSYVLLGSKSFTISHSVGSGTASFTIGASSTTSSDSAGYMIGAWEMTAESITPPSLPDTYTVAYNSGIATSGSAPSSQTKIYGTNLTLRTNTGSLAKSNDTSTITTTFNGNGGSSDTKSSTKTTSYSFANWNTSRNGSGTDYASGGTYTSNSGITLYPKFSSSTSYGSITTPSSSRTGYTFNGWYNSTSGGTKYADGGVSKTPTSSQTYYAQWTVVTYTVTVHHRVYGSTTDFATTSGSRTYDNSYTPSYTTKTGYHSYDRTVISANTTGTDCYCYYKPNTYTVKYNGNSSTSGSTSDTSMTYDTSSNLNSNGFARAYTLQYNADGGTTPSSTTATYSFSKWNTNSSGTGTDYNAGASVSNLTTTNNGTFNLYAKWTSASVTLPTSTKAGYTFSGWYNGSTLIGQSGATYTPTSSFTAKASWSGIPYSIVFNNNTGSGSMDNQSVVYGQYATLNANEFTKSGSSFYGWNTQADGSGTSYKDKTSVSNLIVPTSSSDTVILYAQWESIIPISLHADSTNNVADGVAIGKKSEGGNKFEIGFDTEIGNSTTNFHLKLNGQDITAGQTGNIDDVQVNGTSVVSNRVANITSIPASIVNGTVASATSDSNGDNISNTYFKKSGGSISGATEIINQTSNTWGLKINKGNNNYGMYINCNNANNLAITTEGQINCGKLLEESVLLENKYARLGAHNNLIASGNEFTFVPSGYSGDILINYRTAGGLNGNITDYIFGKGDGNMLGTALHTGNTKDYVTTYASNGTYIYRVWSSGIKELLLGIELTYSKTASALMGGYYAYVDVGGFPFTIAPRVVNCDARLGTGIGYVYCADREATNYVRLHVFGNQNATSVVVTHLYILGV